MTHKQTEKNSNFLTSLKHAIDGIKTVIREERNMKAHLCIAGLAIIISFFSGLSAVEWCFILLCISHGNLKHRCRKFSRFTSEKGISH